MLKSKFLILGLCIVIVHNAYSQDIKTVDSEVMKKYNELLQNPETNEAILNFCDPLFPQMDEASFNHEMRVYAKAHRPVPELKNTGSSDYDNDRYNYEIKNWLYENPYYPQFIPYHLFNMRLTIEDDIRYYEAAKVLWIKNNPEKYEEIQKIKNR